MLIPAFYRRQDLAPRAEPPLIKLESLNPATAVLAATAPSPTPTDRPYIASPTPRPTPSVVAKHYTPLRPGAIVGIVVGGLILVSVAILLFMWHKGYGCAPTEWRRKFRAIQHKKPHSGQPLPTVPEDEYCDGSRVEKPQPAKESQSTTRVFKYKTTQQRILDRPVSSHSAEPAQGDMPVLGVDVSVHPPAAAEGSAAGALGEGPRPPMRGYTAWAWTNKKCPPGGHMQDQPGYVSSVPR